MAKRKPKKARPKKRVAGRKGRPAEGTEDWRPAFLQALATGSHVNEAAKIAKVHGVTPYKEREQNEEFRNAWDSAEKLGTDLLEGEASRRAFHGTLKPVFQKGELVGHVREYSDTLLIFLLKSRRPEVYRENVKHELTGANGGPIMIQGIQINWPSDPPLTEPDFIHRESLNGSTSTNGEH